MRVDLLRKIRTSPALRLYVGKTKALQGADVCTKLGISEAQLRNLIKQGDLVPMDTKVGKALLFRERDVRKLAAYREHCRGCNCDCHD